MIYSVALLCLMVLGLIAYLIHEAKGEGKQEAIHEATAKEKDALADVVRISDRVDNVTNLDELRQKLNNRPL